MWDLDHKEDWVLKNWCFPGVVLEKTLESLLDSKEIKSVSSKEINSEYSLEGLMLKLQNFGHLMWRADSVEKTLIMGKVEGMRRRGWQRWLDSITDLMGMSFSKLRKIVKDREAWPAAVHGVAKSWTQLSDHTKFIPRDWDNLVWLKKQRLQRDRLWFICHLYYFPTGSNYSIMPLLLLLSHFSHVWLCATP